jgi:hypothetical protein
VKKPAGAVAVQVVLSRRAGKAKLIHVGTARGEVELELLKAHARGLLPQPELELGWEQRTVPGGQAVGAPKTVGTRPAELWSLLERAWRALGFDSACPDLVFEHLALARIIEPTSKQDSLRVLAEAGVPTCSYRTIKRRLPLYARPEWSAWLAAACAGHAGLDPAALVLYDVTTLHFEIHEGDGFRESGYSKIRRLEPQITVGLLTDREGFPLQVRAFEGNRAETKTMLPVIREFMAAHELKDVTVVADAGMISDANKLGIEEEGLSFIIGAKLPEIPYQILQWRRLHPQGDPPDGLTLVQPRPATGKAKTKGARDRKTIYRYDAKRARRTLKGIDEQVRKAEDAVAGRKPVKHNRFVRLDNTSKSVNRDLEAKARELAGWKAYETNLDEDPGFVVNAYHDLWHVENSFRMSKNDLMARPVFHHKRESIDAHITIVFAALAVSKWIEAKTGWTIRRIVKTLRAYRTATIRIGNRLIDADADLPDDIQAIINLTR